MEFEFEDVKCNTLPGLDSLPDSATFPVRVGTNQDVDLLVPQIDRKYWFNPSTAPEIFAFATSVVYGVSQSGCMLSGPPGTGKSSLVQQLLAHMRYPLMRSIGHKGQDLSEVVGRLDLAGGYVNFLPGPLLNAYTNGFAYMHEEFDRTPSSVTVGYNTFLDRTPFLPALEGCNKPYHCHKNHMFFATGNSGGCGDHSGICETSLSFDFSTNDRMWTIQVNYMKPEDELKMLESVIGGLPIRGGVPLDFFERSINFANDTRNYLFGNDVSKSDMLGALTFPISSRGLIRLWEALIVLRNYLPTERIGRSAVGLAFGNKCSPEGKIALENLLALHLQEYF